MTILPIFKRELQAAARRGREPWNRAAFGCSCWQLCWAPSPPGTTRGISKPRAGSSRSPPHGRSCLCSLFTSLVIFDAGLGQSARCIAEEKERRTLDFLLTTRLENAEIILGKLAARMVVFASDGGGRVAGDPPARSARWG